MSLFANARTPDTAALEAWSARVWAEAADAPPGRYDPRDAFEPVSEDLGHSRDDDEMADRAADREWAARWGR